MQFSSTSWPKLEFTFFLTNLKNKCTFVFNVFYSQNIPYILESNPHPFYSFRGLKNQMRITIACGLDSRLRAGFWKNDGAAVCAVRTIQYNNLFYLLL